jgi:hypothetical protein
LGVLAVSIGYVRASSHLHQSGGLGRVSRPEITRAAVATLAEVPAPRRAWSGTARAPQRDTVVTARRKPAKRGDARGRRYRRYRRSLAPKVPFPISRARIRGVAVLRTSAVSVGFGVRVRDDDGDRRAAGRVAERGPGRDELDKQTAPLAPLGPVTFFIFLKEHRAEPIIPPNKNPGWPPSRMAHPRSTCGKIARLVALERDCRRPLVHTKHAAERMRLSEAMTHFPRATLGVPGA